MYRTYLHTHYSLTPAPDVLYMYSHTHTHYSLTPAPDVLYMYSHTHSSLTPAPDDAPGNVRVWALSSTSLHVEWNPPSTEGHQLTVTQYVVNYNEVGDSNVLSMTAPATTPDDRHSYDITGLKPYRDYVIVVHATNDAGNSPGSLPHSFRTASASESVKCLNSSL